MDLNGEPKMSKYRVRVEVRQCSDGRLSSVMFFKCTDSARRYCEVINDITYLEANWYEEMG